MCSSLRGGHPEQDFPKIAEAYINRDLNLDELATSRNSLFEQGHWGDSTASQMKRDDVTHLSRGANPQALESRVKFPG